MNFWEKARMFKESRMKANGGANDFSHIPTQITRAVEASYENGFSDGYAFAKEEACKLIGLDDPAPQQTQPAPSIDELKKEGKWL